MADEELTKENAALRKALLQRELVHRGVNAKVAGLLGSMHGPALELEIGDDGKIDEAALSESVKALVKEHVDPTYITDPDRARATDQDTQSEVASFEAARREGEAAGKAARKQNDTTTDLAFR